MVGLLPPELPNRRAAARWSTKSDLNRVANAPIKLHALHPPPSADPTQRDICCRTFAPALPKNPAASVTDYCSGAYSVGICRIMPGNRNS